VDDCICESVVSGLMPHEFIRHEEEPEPQDSGNRSGGPPKHTAAGVLDPPFPPKKPLRPIPPISRSTVIRLIAVVILVGFALVTVMMIWRAF
jgi:hypothetical protein